MVEPLVDNGDANPEGCVWWFNGATWSPDWTQDTGIIIVSDGEGLLCNLNTGKWGKWGSVVLGYTNYGQTFTARGTGLVSASFTVNTNGNYVVSLYNYSGGSVGSQVGTSKTLAAGAYVESNAVIWSPGEFPPLVVGNTYYIEIRRQDGATFGVYRASGDLYSGGMFFVNRTAQPAYDIASTIYVESAAGEAAKPWIKLGDGWPQVTNQTSSSITIYWTTDIASDTRVDYAVGRPPYTASYYNSSLTTSHSAVLTGLSPNTVYHYRVSSARSGYQTAVSRDFVASTLPSGANLISNPGFETGALAPWVSWSGSVQVHHGEWFWNMPPRSGVYAAQFAQNGGPYTTTGIYQQVSVTPGKWYRATGWFALFPTENINSVDYLKYDAFGESSGRLMKARIGLDPSGGTNGNSASIAWSRSAYSFPNPNTFQGNQASAYHYICQSAISRATGSTMTVFIAVDAGASLSWDCWSVDDFAMSEVPTIDVAAAKTAGNGEQVAISNAVVTATAPQVGAYYVEDADRSSGIRVESADSANVGDVVTVFGGIGTNADGERTVKNGSIAYVSGSASIAPVGMSCRSLGGAGFEYSGTSGQEGVAGGIGLNNIGLLVRAWGKVVERDPVGGFFRIDDGSLASDGTPVRPKVIMPAGVGAPELDRVVIVTGLSSCEKVGGELRPLLRMRNSADLRIVL